MIVAQRYTVVTTIPWLRATIPWLRATHSRALFYFLLSSSWLMRYLFIWNSIQHLLI